MPLTSPMAHSCSAARDAHRPERRECPARLRRFQGRCPHPRSPARGHEQPVATQHRPSSISTTKSRPHAAPQSRSQTTPALSPLAEDIAESIAQRSRLVTEHAFSHVDDHRSAAKSTHGLGHLDPTGPPPRMSSRSGMAFIDVTSRLVQTPSNSRSPGMGGTTGSAPLASTTWSAVWRTPSTSTTPGPASLPVPRRRSMPRPANHFTWPESE